VPVDKSVNDTLAGIVGGIFAPKFAEHWAFPAIEIRKRE
jgi:hypothetical protein